MQTIDAKRLGQGWMVSPFKFSRHGRCGMELSELLPHLAPHADLPAWRARLAADGM